MSDAYLAAVVVVPAAVYRRADRTIFGAVCPLIFLVQSAADFLEAAFAGSFRWCDTALMSGHF